jgi:hypothetical protein
MFVIGIAVDGNTAVEYNGSLLFDVSSMYLTLEHKHVNIDERIVSNVCRSPEQRSNGALSNVQ